MRSVSCLISFKIWIRHVRKKNIFYNIESRLFHYLVLIIMYIEKSSALRRRSKLSTQPFLYRILVSGKLSTQPLIYRILVSGKLSLYTYSNKYKEKSQDGFPLLFYADSYIRTYISICPTSWWVISRCFLQHFIHDSIFLWWLH